jgi:hypothetical protein
MVAAHQGGEHQSRMSPDPVETESGMGHELSSQKRQRHVRCTPDSRRLAATHKSAAPGQEQTFLS